MKLYKIEFLLLGQVFFPYRWLHHPDEIQVRVYIFHFSHKFQPEPVSLYCNKRVHRDYPVVL